MADFKDVPVDKVDLASEALKKEMRKYCRTCGQMSNLPLTNIYDRLGLKMKLPAKLELLCDVTRDDVLPNQLCENCIEDLEAAYSYSIRIQKAEKKLNDICNHIRNSLAKQVEPQNGAVKDGESCNHLESAGSESDDIFEDFEEFDPMENFNSDSDDQELPQKRQLAKVEEPDELKRQKLEIERLEFEIELEKDDLFSEIFTKNIEENTMRIKNILRSNEKTDFTDFVKYLKQRKILVSKLRDNDIEFFYDVYQGLARRKHNKSLDNEIQDCDYCLKSFTDARMAKVHELTHEFKILPFCEDCLKTFETLREKKSHLCDRKLSCKYCNRVFDKKSLRRSHEYVHYYEYNKLCDICGQDVENLPTLNSHIKTCHRDLRNKYYCQFCLKRFNKREELYMHRRIHDQAQKISTQMIEVIENLDDNDDENDDDDNNDEDGGKKLCKVCEVYVPTKLYLAHMCTHNNFFVKCPKCPKKFKSQRRLSRHVRTHSNARKFACDVCDASFKRTDHLRKHILTHIRREGNILAKVGCVICFQNFDNESNLLAHMVDEHSYLESQNFSCRLCRLPLRCAQTLRSHMEMVHAQTFSLENQRSFCLDCLHCQKKFSTERSLMYHVKEIHLRNGQKLHCNICGKSYTTEVNLRNHLLNDHNGALNSKAHCLECDKWFITPDRLRIHTLSHTDKRAFICEICNAGFHRKAILQQHVNNCHIGFRPYKCSTCPAEFKQKSTLVSHRRIHEERKYWCKICGTSYHSLFDKRRHEKQHEVFDFQADKDDKRTEDSSVTGT